MPQRVSVRPLVAGNWKMNGLKGAGKEIRSLANKLAKLPRLPCDVLVCPPATLLTTMAAAARKSRIRIGGQDCHTKESGAHTGDISARMIRDAGGRYVIVGHSERRMNHGETSAIVRDKALAVLRSGQKAIICIGETEAERDEGKTLRVLTRQLDGSLDEAFPARETVIAYEPVWAIGTGRTPMPREIAQAHAHIRKRLIKRFGEAGAKIRILYGGSVKPANARSLMAVEHVNGALVGGASLRAVDFYGIISAYL